MIKQLFLLSVILSGTSIAYPDDAFLHFRDGNFRHSAEILAASTNRSTLENYILARDYQELREPEKASYYFGSVDPVKLVQDTGISWLSDAYTGGFSKALADYNGRSPLADYSGAVQIMSGILTNIDEDSPVYDDAQRRYFSFQWKSGNDAFFTGFQDTNGFRYYIEALQKEGAGGDNLAVTWQKPGDPAPVNGDPPIPGACLVPYGLGPPLITLQPANLVVVESSSAAFAVQLAVKLAATYQWYRGANPITGATNASLTLSPVLLADSGSLFLLLDVRPHQFFKRRENDILLNLDINVAQAALGAEIEVPTLDGDEKLRIPSGTQPGKVFHLKGKGVPHLRRNSRGDQLVIINVAVPNKLTKEQRELFEQLAESLGTTVKPQEKGFLDWLNETLGG